MSDAEYFESCTEFIELINCVHAQKRKHLLTIRKSHDKYSLVITDCNVEIFETEFLDKFYQRLLGIACYLTQFN